jgi:hypothetical protein
LKIKYQKMITQVVNINHQDIKYRNQLVVVFKMANSRLAVLFRNHYSVCLISYYKLKIILVKFLLKKLIL